MAKLENNRITGSGNESFKQIEGDSWSNIYLPAICAAVIMTVVLFVVACSKKSDNGASRISAPAQPAVTSPTMTAASVPAALAPKKIKKHRPANATYVNGRYGVSFSYPRKYSLAAGNGKPESPVKTSFLKPGGIEIAAVDMPDDTYPDTDFSSALLNVSVNPGMSADECANFVPASNDPEAAKPSMIKLGANEFTELEMMGGEMTHQSDLKYFHLFKNDACYEFALDVETSRKADEELAQVDRSQVFKQLEKMLTSARIKDVQVPGVERAETATSTETAAIDSKPDGVTVSPGKPAEPTTGESKAAATTKDGAKADKTPTVSTPAADSKTEKAQVVTPEEK